MAEIRPRGNRARRVLVWGLRVAWWQLIKAFPPIVLRNLERRTLQTRLQTCGDREARTWQIPQVKWDIIQYTWNEGHGTGDKGQDRIEFGLALILYLLRGTWDGGQGTRQNRIWL